MIKVILEIGRLNYDVFLDQALKYMKEHPEQMGGMKLPPFSDKMIKMLPAAKKNELLIQAVHSQKSMMLMQAQQMLSTVAGAVRLYDIDVLQGNSDKDVLQVIAEIADFDKQTVIDHFLPLYYSEYTAEYFLGEAYTGSYDLNAVQAYMKQQDQKKTELLLAKSMSTNRSYLMQMLERGAMTKGIELRMNNMRFMIK